MNEEQTERLLELLKEHNTLLLHSNKQRAVIEKRLDEIETALRLIYGGMP